MSNTTQIVFTKATVAFLIKDDKVLLGLRKKVSNGLGDQLIAGIGGKVDVGETFDETMVRELQEEIDITPTEYKYIGDVQFIFPNKPKWCQYVKVYIVTKWKGTPTEIEKIKPMWFLKNELPFDRMWEDNKYWVPKLLSETKFDYTFVYNDDGKVQIVASTNY